jgi:hypothetical protein
MTVMRGRFFTGTVAMVGVLLILTGCGANGGSGQKGNAGPAPKPLEVMDQMRADVQAAVKFAMPGRELNEPSYDTQNCASSKWRVTPGSSKVVASETVGAIGGVSDKRSADEIVGQVVKALESRGWKIHDGVFASGDPSKEMTKSGVYGKVQIAAGRHKSSSSETFPTLNATMFSDCLPNPAKS